MIVVCLNDESNNNTFGYKESPTRVFIHYHITNTGQDFWHDYCVSSKYGEVSFASWLESLGFKETEDFQVIFK